MRNENEEINILEKRIRMLKSKVIYLNKKETVSLADHIKKLKLRKIQLETGSINE